MKRRQRIPFLLMISYLLWPSNYGWAQTRDPQASKRDEKIRVHVDLVLLDAQVIDKRGQPVYTLKADDFRVYEDGVLQEITAFSVEHDQPVSLAILLDNSRSMTETPFLTAKETIRHLIHLLKPEDEIMLATYHKDFYLEQDFTGERPKILQALDNIYLRAPNGKMASALGTLFGAERAYTGLGIDLAILRLRQRKYARKVLLVISNRFTGMGPATTDHARNAEIPIFALSYQNIGWALLSLGGDKMALKDTVGESGGLVYKAEAQDVRQALQTLIYGFKNYYQIGYMPSNKSREDKVRKIRLETMDKSLVVRTRRSYSPVNKERERR